MQTHVSDINIFTRPVVFVLVSALVLEILSAVLTGIRRRVTRLLVFIL